MSVRTIIFESLRHSRQIFAHLVYTNGIQDKFIYEGHRVKITVTAIKKVENPYCRNIKLHLPITQVL